MPSPKYTDNQPKKEQKSASCYKLSGHSAAAMLAHRGDRLPLHGRDLCHLLGLGQAIDADFSSGQLAEAAGRTSDQYFLCRAFAAFRARAA